MLRAFEMLLLACWASVGLAEDTSVIKFPSPDGRFALRVTDLKVGLIETPSGKVMVDLGTLWVDPEDKSNKEEPVLVWLGDSKWVALRHPYVGVREYDCLFLGWFGLQGASFARKTA